MSMFLLKIAALSIFAFLLFFSRMPSNVSATKFSESLFAYSMSNISIPFLSLYITSSALGVYLLLKPWMFSMLLDTRLFMKSSVMSVDYFYHIGSLSYETGNFSDLSMYIEMALT